MSRILLLDDDVSRLSIFKKNLIGHEVITTMTAPQAIRELDTNGPFDYAFLDHDLGDKILVPSGPGTGYEVAKWLANNPEKQPKWIIIHSFNPEGSKNMAAVLPKATICPGAWNKINVPTITQEDEV